jgi:hypothetical protein
MVWERVDIASAVPLDIDPGFDFRQVRCRRAIADGEWMLVEGNHQVWTSRDGRHWFDLGPDSHLDIALHPYAHSADTSGGILTPPKP